MKILQFFKYFDWRLFIPLFLLISIGVVVIYSATWEEGGANLAKIKVQIIAAGIGFFLLIGLSLIDYRFLKNYRFIVYILMLLLLIAVLFWGSTIRGSRSWFSLGPFRFQPSEMAKIFLIITLASFFADHQEHISRLKVLLISGFLTALPVSLIILEHDLGAAVILLVVWVGMLIVAGLKLKHILITLSVFILVSLVAWLFLLVPYQKSRIIAFFNPHADPLGVNYNLIQSMIAVGSGGIWGKGLGHGSQSQLKFLPEPHTDFIFAVTAEEFGFFGGFVVLVLFALLILRILKVGRLSLDKFGVFLASGVAILILSQVMINIGMNIGLVPVAGIALPLISYGGSALISFLISLGLIESIYMNYRKVAFGREK
ncbi:MAG: rod shape-determining protein RodA [Patescibacteria group bacterium]|nr:rod shape-determining protein RodA [Patescibacteria group bacterium]